MNNEIVKMKRAKMYVDYLISGVDPVDNENIDSETFKNERVVACFKYISEVLERDIYSMEKRTSRSNMEFYITDIQDFEKLRAFQSVIGSFRTDYLCPISISIC